LIRDKMEAAYPKPATPAIKPKPMPVMEPRKKLLLK